MLTPGSGTGLAGPPGVLQASVSPRPDADSVSSGVRLRQRGHPRLPVTLHGPLFTRVLDSRNEGLQPGSRIGLGLAWKHRSRLVRRDRWAPAFPRLHPSQLKGGKPGAQVSVCPAQAKRWQILALPSPRPISISTQTGQSTSQTTSPPSSPQQTTP